MLFIGYFPLMPGTIGSALVVAGLWYLQFQKHFVFTPKLSWIVVIAAAAISTVVSSRPKAVFGKEDPKQIIIDECAGQMVTFFLVPITLNTLVLGFLLFRFFDIIKPFPIYKMEELEGGLGITADDIVAGIFANASLIISLELYHFVKMLL